MEVNEEKRKKFMENAGKRVNKVMYDIQILEPMARSSVYDFTKEDVKKMFMAMQEALDTAKEEYNKKFEGRAKTERKLFSFDSSIEKVEEDANVTNDNVDETIESVNTIDNNIDKAVEGVLEESVIQN